MKELEITAIESPDASTLAPLLIALLEEFGMTLATAESCTGGLVGKLLTDVPGASNVYMGGCITYTNEIKQKLLGVKADTLACHTAVSAPVASEMSDGVRRLLGTDIGVSVTGYAGPGGGTAEHPVGTVFVGISIRGQTEVLELHFPALTRCAVREAAATALLSHLIAKLTENGGADNPMCIN